MKNIQYTIRNIPAPVDEVLRKRAQKRGTSFNQTIVEALEKATGQTTAPNTAFEWFIGSGSNERTKQSEKKAQDWLDSLPTDL